MSEFVQKPPRLGNQYHEDRVLKSHLRRVLPGELVAQFEPALTEMGRLASEDLYTLQQADRLNEPRLTRWDPWGQRVDRIDLTPLWQTAERLAAEHGLVACGYDPALGRYARICQFALVYLFHPSTDVYTCPLAMTDGAARTLLDSGNQSLIERAVPHLLTRDPGQFWTSGQWMTELTGGSDVGSSTTVAREDDKGRWRLYGRKWFTSAAASQMALTLARPEGNKAGGSGLALFYVEPRDHLGQLQNIRIERLKDKLGTRKVPTAELVLDGAPAQLVVGRDHGVRHIVPMLMLTRTWNSVCAIAFMRRGIALVRSYADVRQVFGRSLSEQPLHLDTLAGLQAELEGALHLTFHLIGLLGRGEHGELDETGSALLRVLTSVVKLTTGRQAPAVLSEVVEAFGGAGYVEDTGLPALLRDAHVLPIWEGTTNVLALDSWRALVEDKGLEAFGAELQRCLATAREESLTAAARLVREAWGHIEQWFDGSVDRDVQEAGARGLALTLGRCLALALLVEHAQWSIDHEGDTRALAAARRFADHGVDRIAEVRLDESIALAKDKRP